MKKSFLILLSSILAVFLITGCADDTTSNNGGNGGTTPPTVVPIDPTDPTFASLIGDYEIVFFYTNGSGYLSIASDCSKVEYYTGKADTKCVQGHNSVDFKGYGKIGVNNLTTPTNVNIQTKMQMTNECLKNPAVGACANDKVFGVNAWERAQNNQYNYNVFNPIPLTAIENGALNSGTHAVTGVTGRNLIANVNTTGSTYKFELLSDGTIRNTMVDKSSLVPANVTVIMKKIETLPSGYTLDKDVAFPEPSITGFVQSPAAATTTAE